MKKIEMRAVTMAAALCLAAGLTFGQAVPAGDVMGVSNFSHIVTSLERSVEFYRDVLGLEVTLPPRPFDPNPAIMKMGNTLGAQSRISVLKVPGFAVGLELIEYKDIDRKPAHPRFQDPGAGNLEVRVRDLDAVVARLKKAGSHILTAGGEPALVGKTRAMFVQDPDGFIVELSQPVPAPAPTAELPGNVFGGVVEITVEDAVKTVAFYRDALGFQPTAPAPFNGDKLMTDTAGTPGARFRQSHAPIPCTPLAITFIEFQDIDRKTLHTRVQDPGTALLQLTVRDVDALLPKLKAAGATIVSEGGDAVNIGNNMRIAIVRDPNNLFLELIQRKP
jgi:catechol 2,3-dioxygenase-like lactoylglutathione lyase family enzyme